MSDTGIVDTFLDTFTSYIDSGFGLLGGEVGFLSSTLIAIDVTIAGLFWAWGADEDVIQRLVKKTLYIGAFAFIIGNFQTLATILFDSFAGLGLKASGDALMALARLHAVPATIAATRSSMRRSPCSTRSADLVTASGRSLRQLRRRSSPSCCSPG